MSDEELRHKAKYMSLTTQLTIDRPNERETIVNLWGDVEKRTAVDDLPSRQGLPLLVKHYSYFFFFC